MRTVSRLPLSLFLELSEIAFVLLRLDYVASIRGLAHARVTVVRRETQRVHGGRGVPARRNRRKSGGHEIETGRQRCNLISLQALKNRETTLTGFEPVLRTHCFYITAYHRKWISKNIAGHRRTLCNIVIRYDNHT